MMHLCEWVSCNLAGLLRPGVRSMRNKKTVLLSAMLSSLPVYGAAQIDNYQPYHILLARECPANHLEWLSPADLNDMIVIDFKGSLAPSQKATLDRANDEKLACANVTMGATCENVSYLKAMYKTGLLNRFAKSVCASGLSCRSQSDCRKTRP
jgi:hypothetical protein